MTCAHLAAVAAGCDPCFTVDVARVTFGAGALAEVGPRLRAHGVARAAVFVDPRVHALPWFAEVAASLAAVNAASSSARRSGSASEPLMRSALRAANAASSAAIAFSSALWSVVPISAVPLKAMCSRMCDRPVMPRTSSALPTFTKVRNENTGTSWSSSTMNFTPLSSVNSWTLPSRSR